MRNRLLAVSGRSREIIPPTCRVRGIETLPLEQIWGPVATELEIIEADIQKSLCPMHGGFRLNSVDGWNRPYQTQWGQFMYLFQPQEFAKYQEFELYEIPVDWEIRWDNDGDAKYYSLEYCGDEEEGAEHGEYLRWLEVASVFCSLEEHAHYLKSLENEGAL